MPGGSFWTQDYADDASGRLQTISSPAGTFSYSYLGASRLVQQLTLPNSSVIANTYDSLSQLTQTLLRHSNGSTLNLHGYSYNPAHQRTRYSRASHYTEYAYDNTGQLLTARRFENNGATRWNEQLSYT